MKNKAIFAAALLFAFACLQAQELDSLRNIMENRNGVDLPPDEGPSYPVYVEENGDQVKIQVFDKEVLKVVDNSDSTYVKLGNSGLIEVNDQPDSTTIRVGDKEIHIVEKYNEPEVWLEDLDCRKEVNPRKFRGHWAGAEWGINNFLDKDLTLSREGDAQFMDLHTGRSWVVNLNFAQYSVGFGTSHAGVVTGMGLEFNNYFFDGPNTLAEINDQIVEVPLDQENLSKSKLTASWLRVPVIFEVQFPGVIRARRVFLSAGVVGALKLGSHTKVLYKNDNGKSKDKNNDDFNISPFRYGFTARVGFGTMSIFADYYVTPFFVQNKGPELHPFSIGLSSTF